MRQDVQHECLAALGQQNMVKKRLCKRMNKGYMQLEVR